MHGDYSPYNVMASARDTRRLAAVVDWDTGTIGDPLLDLGHLLARWTEPGEEPAIGVWDIEIRDGEDWILNGEKWFSSSASISDYALVMARTDADARRHRQFTTFLVELPDPGYQIIRDIPTLHEAVQPGLAGESTGGGSGATCWRRSASQGPPPRRSAATCSDHGAAGNTCRPTFVAHPVKFRRVQV